MPESKNYVPGLGTINGIYLDVPKLDYSSNVTTSEGLGPTMENLGKSYSSGTNVLSGEPMSNNQLFNSFKGLGTLQGVGVGLQGLGTLANAFMGYKNYKLAKDAFNFNKDMKQKEYAMAKDAYDKNVARAKSIGSQMREGKVV